MGRPIREPTQRITKRGDSLTWLNATELYLPILETAMCGTQCWGRAEIDRSCDSSARGIAPKIGIFSVKLKGEGMRSVHIFLNYRHPGVFQVTSQFGLHSRVIPRDVGR